MISEVAIAGRYELELCEKTQQRLQLDVESYRYIAHTIHE